MKKALMLGVAVALVWPAGAEAWKVPLPAAPIEWRIAQCPGETTRACAIRQPTHTIIYVRSDALTNETAWHELGHAFDYFNMTDQARNRWRSIMGEPRSWRSAPNSPHEQFAESYSMCALNSRRPNRKSWDYDYRPTVRQHRAVCRLIRGV